MRLAIDFANYAGYLNADVIGCWKQQGVSKVIIRASTEDAERIAIARNQMQVCHDGGLAVEAYLWLNFVDLPNEQVKKALELFQSSPIGLWWLDCEEGIKWEAGPVIDWIAWALKSFGKTKVGIYTSYSWWTAKTNNTTRFANRRLWNASWGIAPKLTLTKSFAGRKKATMHQYKNDVSLCGIGVDLNAY